MNSIKKSVQKIIARVQKILIFILLLCLYIVGFGVTKLFIYVFGKAISSRKNEGCDTFWLEAQGYASDIGDCERES